MAGARLHVNAVYADDQRTCDEGNTGGGGGIAGGGDGAVGSGGEPMMGEEGGDG